MNHARSVTSLLYTGSVPNASVYVQLYVHLADAQVEVAEGALGGAIAGAIGSAVNAVVNGILTLTFGTVGTASNLLGGEGEAALLTASTTVGCVVMGIVVGTIIGAILGAGGGLVYAAIKGRSS